MKIERAWVQANGARLRVTHAGSGSAVVLLHGWPVTGHHWRHVLPRLAEEHLVIVPDLRGLGESERTTDGYGKPALAQDIAALVDQFGAGRYAVVGHDFGASVSVALAAEHRDRVSHLVVIEELFAGCPVPRSLSHPAYPRWHPAFHAAPEAPELLISGREREYLRFFWSLTGDRAELAAAEEYTRTYLAPGALEAGLAYYRTASADADANWAIRRDPVRLPTLAVGGERAIGRAVEAGARRLSRRVTGVVLPGCGHYPAEEQPDRVADLIAAFITS